MNHTTECLPSVWTSADECFFLIAHELFAPDFLAGAGALLASYDSDVPPHGDAAEQAGTDTAFFVGAGRATA